MVAFQSVAGNTAVPSEKAAAQHAYLALARRFRKADFPILGLWPTSIKTRLADVSVCLASALASLGLHVGVFAPDQWRDNQPENQPAKTVLSEGVEAISPTSARSSVSATLERTLEDVRDLYDHILLDLSGLNMVELKEVALVPNVGTAFCVVPGSLTEFALARLRRQVPPGRLLGVVFLDDYPDGQEALYGI